MTNNPQPPAKTLWHYLENTADDIGNIVAVGVLAAGGAVYWLEQSLAEALRPTLGQSADAVVIGTGLAVVTAAGITYVVYKKRRGDDGTPNQPRRPILPTLPSVSSFIRGGTEPAAPMISTEAEAPPSSLADSDTTRSWELMEEISKFEHVFIVSGTGGGKTVFITAIMQKVVAAGGKYFVLDGKPEGDWSAKWPGASGKIRDNGRFVPFMGRVVEVLEQRKANSAARFPALWIVLDECQNITGKYEEVEEAVARLSSEGRAFNIHVLMATQAGTVKQVGFDGRLAVIENNFQAIHMERNESGRTFAPARFKNGGISPFSVRHPVPHLPAAWADTSHLPLYDDSGELGPFSNGRTAVQPPLPHIIPNGANGAESHPTSGANGGANGVVLAGANGATRLDTAVNGDSPQAPVLTETKRIMDNARRLIETMTEESVYPNGKGFLTVGQATAIFYLNQMEFSRNGICEFVFGYKNPDRLTAVAGVLDKSEAYADSLHNESA